MIRTAATAGMATAIDHGLPAKLTQVGAKAVPRAAPIAGAKQSTVVSWFVTRMLPIKREKIDVNGAMKRICALMPSKKPMTMRQADTGGKVKTRTPSVYNPAAIAICSRSSRRSFTMSSEITTESAEPEKFTAAMLSLPQPSCITAKGWNVAMTPAFMLTSNKLAMMQKVTRTRLRYL